MVEEAFMFLLIWLLSLSVEAKSPVTQIWRLKSVELKLVEAPKGGLINPSCLSDQNCEALRAVSKKEKNIPSLAGGTNPGSTVCRKKNGVVLMAERLGSTQGLCRFKDGSYASLDGLFR